MICDFHQDISASSNKDNDEDDDEADNNATAYVNNNFDDDNVSLSLSLQASRESFNMLKERQHPPTTDGTTSENELNETQFAGGSDGRSCTF